MLGNFPRDDLMPRYRMLSKPTIEQLIEIADNPPVFIGRVTQGAGENGWATIEHPSGSNIRAIAVGGPVERGNVAVYRWRSGFIAMGVAPQIVREWRGPGFLSGVVPQVEQVLSEPAALVECACVFYVHSIRTGEGPDEFGNPGQIYDVEQRADFYLWDGSTVRRIYQMGGDTILTAFPHNNLPLFDNLGPGNFDVFRACHLTMLGGRRNIVQIVDRNRLDVSTERRDIYSFLAGSGSIEAQESWTAPANLPTGIETATVRAIPYGAPFSASAYSLACYSEGNTTGTVTPFMGSIRDSEGGSSIPTIFTLKTPLSIAANTYSNIAPDEQYHVGTANTGQDVFPSMPDIIRGFSYSAYKKGINTLVESTSESGENLALPDMSAFTAPISGENLESMQFNVSTYTGNTNNGVSQMTLQQMRDATTGFSTTNAFTNQDTLARVDDGSETRTIIACARLQMFRND